MDKKQLSFSYNWNNKLQCKSFSTIRVYNPKKYVLLDEYDIVLNNNKGDIITKFGLARLQVIHKFKLYDVSPAITFLDANLSTIEFITLIKTMYKNKNVDFKNQFFAFMVFQYIN